ncbi:DNA repair protein RecO [Sphingomonas piscis]|uniref:DNA repair protein RecO n=1 Tax=Sphingomonas piscis TaxID=2714943 RepID=A0A6G7YSB9_9SPHN|nr:DNA repair protein RecO [Sphingomonas piscis]QIK79621.1 DNA repair protein RecO [Sphingomonas piscis]
MLIETDAIVCGLRAHGEHGAVVRLMTPRDGLQAAYVRGARGRRMRPVLLAGNVVQARLRARTEGQLAQAEVELVHSRALLMSEPLPAAAIEWATVLAATALPEAQPYPRLHAALDGLLSAIEAAPSASGWGAALVRYELLLLAELGFGLDLDSCALSGSQEDLVAVSPRSGRAVNRAEAQPYGDRLLPLPGFVRAGGVGSWRDILDGLRLSGHFLTRDLLTDRAAPILEARSRLVDRIGRASGLGDNPVAERGGGA